MIRELAKDGRVITAARISRLFPAIGPLEVLDLSNIDLAILEAAANVAVADEAEKYGDKRPVTDVSGFDFDD